MGMGMANEGKGKIQQRQYKQIGCLHMDLAGRFFSSLSHELGSF